ncbi:hypothetical protein NXZ66_00965 [Glaesserella parasuis]|nr:hypothetical protein NXZ66_00965 [Glaesserella parasuis]
MKFISLPSIRSTVAQLISNASLAFALATFTGVASSPAWAEANLTPQQLDEEYEQNKLLDTQARDMYGLWSWRMEKKNPTNSKAYGTKTFSEYAQRIANSISPENRRIAKHATRIEKEYGHLSDEELEIVYPGLAKRSCLTTLRLAEAGQKDALNELFAGIVVRYVCGTLTRNSLKREAYNRTYRIAMQIVHEGKWQVAPDILAKVHLYLAYVYSDKSMGSARQDRDKTEYHLEKMKEAYGQACDVGDKESCRHYHNADDYIRIHLAEFDKETGEK